MDCFDDLSKVVTADLSISFKERFPTADDVIIDHAMNLEQQLVNAIKLGGLFRERCVS